MAIIHPNSQSSSLSSGRLVALASDATVKASCYVADGVTMAMAGFHYSSTGAGGEFPGRCRRDWQAAACEGRHLLTAHIV